MAVLQTALALLASGLLSEKVGAQNVSYPSYQNLPRTFDYVIVGGGPGGLTLANRLTEDPAVSVAVVEAGTFYQNIIGNQSTVPGYDFHYDGKSPNATIPFVDWGFVTTPQAGVDDQLVHYVRGKALGGSTALNYMSYTHSSTGAHQMWADEVNDQSYTYANVRKYYEKAMNFTPPADTRFPNATPSYDPADTVQGGPLDVSYAAYAQTWSTWVAKAMDAVGIKNTDAFVNGNIMGSTWMMHTIDHSDGSRASAESMYLLPYLDRPNLAIFDYSLAGKVLFDENKTATAVEVTTNGNTYTLNATCEVIVAGGVFQSPQFLMVSGVGPADVLAQQGIEVVADRAGVGQNLWDHVFFGIGYRVNIETATSLAYGDNLADAIDQYNDNATGQLTSPGGDYAGLEKVPDDLRANFSAETLQALQTFPSDWPELQYLVLPNYVGNVSSPDVAPPHDGYQYATLIAVLVAPKSRGNVSISSPSMSDQPLINPNWLTEQSDIDIVTAGFKRLRQMFASQPMENVTIGEEFYPGSSVSSDDDSQILQQIKDSFSPMYHACATNKMGTADDPEAVVDPQGRVYGVNNLRVVDISAMPFLVPGPSPQVAVYMLSEKIADDIKNGN